jgi:DNA-binding transcriptional ArsR family regulator
MDAKLEEKAKRQADFCSVFSNANRVMILWTLAGREMSVTEIASAIDSSLQNTSQHLSLMKEREILSSRRAGQTIYYRIEDNHLKEFCLLLYQVRHQKPVLEK